MSRSMPAPWLRPTLLDLITESKGRSKKKKHTTHGPRVVQVIRVIEPLDIIVVNDKENYVTVMLTKDCLDDMASEHLSLKDLNRSIIKMEQYHYSTVTHSCGLRDEKMFPQHMITYPIVLQCSKLASLGANDCEVIGEPRDLNKDPEIMAALGKMQFITMAKRLGTRQFPGQGVLPDAGTMLMLLLF
jgi:hypothetical protein